MCIPRTHAKANHSCAHLELQWEWGCKPWRLIGKPGYQKMLSCGFSERACLKKQCMIEKDIQL